MSNALDKPPAKMRKRRLIPIPVRMFLVFGVVLFIATQITGVPLFKEAQERARRIIERNLPVETTAAIARRSLQGRLAAADVSLGDETFIRIFKQEAELEVWMKGESGFRRLHTYPICKHSGFLGPKLKEGDKQAPEGFYAVTAKQLNPGSRHYRAFNIGFPNEYDRAHGRTGSALMVHGGCTSIGCYAMTDLGVAEIYRVVERALKRGQKRVPVHIFPFRMTEANMSTAPAGRWMPFWEQLKVGYDYFEQRRAVPKVSVCKKRYVIGGEASGCQEIMGW